MNPQNNKSSSRSLDEHLNLTISAFEHARQLLSSLLENYQGEISPTLEESARSLLTQIPDSLTQPVSPSETVEPTEPYVTIVEGINPGAPVPPPANASRQAGTSDEIQQIIAHGNNSFPTNFPPSAERTGPIMFDFTLEPVTNSEGSLPAPTGVPRMVLTFTPDPSFSTESGRTVELRPDGTAELRYATPQDTPRTRSSRPTIATPVAGSSGTGRTARPSTATNSSTDTGFANIASSSSSSAPSSSSAGPAAASSSSAAAYAAANPLPPGHRRLPFVRTANFYGEDDERKDRKYHEDGTFTHFEGTKTPPPSPPPVPKRGGLVRTPSFYGADELRDWGPRRWLENWHPPTSVAGPSGSGSGSGSSSQPAAESSTASNNANEAASTTSTSSKRGRDDEDDVDESSRPTSRSRLDDAPVAGPSGSASGSQLDEAPVAGPSGSASASEPADASPASSASSDDDAPSTTSSTSSKRRRGDDDDDDDDDESARPTQRARLDEGETASDAESSISLLDNLLRGLRDAMRRV